MTNTHPGLFTFMVYAQRVLLRSDNLNANKPDHAPVIGTWSGLLSFDAKTDQEAAGNVVGVLVLSMGFRLLWVIW